MTDKDAKLLASLTGFTPGPWQTSLYDTDGREWDRGPMRVMRGEYFGRAVIAKEQLGAVALVPNCHADHDFDAALIAAAPDLLRIATEQAAEATRLRFELAQVVDALGMALNVYINSNLADPETGKAMDDIGYCNAIFKFHSKAGNP